MMRDAWTALEIIFHHRGSWRGNASLPRVWVLTTEIKGAYWNLSARQIPPESNKYVNQLLKKKNILGKLGKVIEMYISRMSSPIHNCNSLRKVRAQSYPQFITLERLEVKCLRSVALQRSNQQALVVIVFKQRRSTPMDADWYLPTSQNCIEFSTWKSTFWIMS